MTSPKFNAEVTAKGVARSSSSAARISALFADQACPYPRHRESDWQPLAGGPLVCGICHPPADDRLVAP